jgi:diguanylate cyclase (GGDEF)-like protein/PAS domain S-box-containing protein
MQVHNRGEEHDEPPSSQLLQESGDEEWCRTVYGALPVGIIVWDTAGLLVYANPAAEALVGRTLDQLRGNTPGGVLRSAAEAAELNPTTLREGKVTAEIAVPASDGTSHHVHIYTSPLAMPQNGPAWAISTILSIDPAREALALERSMLHTLMNSMPDYIYFKDRDSRIIRSNRAHAAYFHLADPSDCLGKTDFDFYSGPVAEALFAEEQRIMRTGEAIVGIVEDQSQFAGQPCWLQSTKVPMQHEGRVIGLAGISRDITDLRLVQDQLAYQAMHDALTGLPNRTLLQDRLEQALATARRSATAFVLCLLDLDDFKTINDTLGHPIGDVLLCEVATRVRGSLRSTDTLARMGGDEFAILLPGTDHDGALAAVLRICQALAEPMNLQGQRVAISGSIGMAHFPLHGADARTLFIHADTAMYAAKQRRAGYMFYDVSLSG